MPSTLHLVAPQVSPLSLLLAHAQACDAAFRANHERGRFSAHYRDAANEAADRGEETRGHIANIVGEKLGPLTDAEKKLLGKVLFEAWS